MIKRRKIPWPRVTVRWCDIVGDSAWMSVDAALGTFSVITRGWLIGEKDGVLRVASSVGCDSDGKWSVSDVNAIPASVAEVVFETRRKKKKGAKEDGGAKDVRDSSGEEK